MVISDERRARNEAMFRGANEKIKEIADVFEPVSSEAPQFVCECGEMACMEPIRLSTHEYERIRSRPTHFFVVPGHERPGDDERVVERSNGYVIVEKSRSAVQPDPRK